MYKVNDIFSSLQGEGYNTGRAATFVRFAGCNLRCSFCDTDFASFREMSAADIVAEITHYPTRFVVLTGGEPSLQTDDALVSSLHKAGFTTAVETNGTRVLPQGIDWVTLSPKHPAAIKPLPKQHIDEIKVIFDGKHDPEIYLPSWLSDERLALSKEVERNQDGIWERNWNNENNVQSSKFNVQCSKNLFLQPCDVGDSERNGEIIRQCIEYIQHHPKWRLSLQTHKLANFK